MKKPTKKAINAELQSVSYYRDNFRLTGTTGCYDHDVRTLASVIARTNGDGDASVSVYAYGDGKSPDDYYMRGICADVTEIFEDWITCDTMRPANECRAEVVSRIQDALVAALEEHDNDGGDGE
jgi:hypothetical protein